MTAETVGATPGRIAICAGTQGYAARLAQYLEHDCDLRVVGVCDSDDALFALVGQTHPDLVILDLDLPHGDSVAITRRVVRERLARVVLVAPHVERQGRRALAGLTAGALEVISQAALDLNVPVGPAAHAVRRGIKRMSMARAQRPANSASPPRSAAPVDVIGVCASTGGPPVLSAVLGRLPRTFAIPVLVVQHMSPGFTERLVTWLDGIVAVPVGLAQAGADMDAGVWLAPDGAHLVIEITGDWRSTPSRRRARTGRQATRCS